MTNKQQTFKTWLLLQQSRNDSIGDFARDVKADSQFPDAGTSKATYTRYLHTHNASAGAIRSFGAAWTEWQHSK